MKCPNLKYINYLEEKLENAKPSEAGSIVKKLVRQKNKLFDKTT